MKASIADAIADGVVVISAAGNSYWPMDISSGQDYNNYFTTASGQVYYNRGGSPASDNAIVVGNIDSSIHSTGVEQKASSSESGPGVTVYAPGTNVMAGTSTINKWGSGSADYESNTSFKQTNISGTSMASPQVAGMAASVLQANPGMTPAQMKTYIHNNATQDLLFTDTQSGTSPVTHAFVIDAANGSSDYTFNSATDRSGAVSGNDPAIIIYEGDTITLTNNTGAHPLYIKWQSSTGTGDVVSTPAATNQGPTNGTVSWTPTVPGVYYYQCSAHLGMNNTITVLPKQAWGDDDSITRSPNRILYSPLWSDPNSMGMKGSITRT